MAGSGGAGGGPAFAGEWRRYQLMALDSFARDCAEGRTRTHVVAPPGSGKTLLGAEMALRRGGRTLVLAPTGAVRAQWIETVSDLRGDGVAGPEPDAVVACLTYQSLSSLDDPGEAFERLVDARWARERAQATGATAAEAAAEGDAMRGAAAERRGRQRARIAAGIRREIARGEHEHVGLADLLSRGARARIEALAGVRTVVLDECHHLASLWGDVVALVLDELEGRAGAPVHRIALTATPPGELTGQEAALYERLLGPVTFTVPTPAVVRDGFLAPYQELAWITRPLPGEERWLSEHDERFRELVTRLHEDPADDLSFPRWVAERLRARTRSADEDAELSWAALRRRRPGLARAGARYLASAGLALPPGVSRDEETREPPGIEDWLELLEDYALKCLAGRPEPAAAERYEAVAAALADLGYVLTRRGVRRGASDVDRLLRTSRAKPLALVEVLGLEMEARSGALRALVLVEAERRRARPDASLAGVLEPEAGTAVEALAALAGDARTAVAHPILVSGRALRCPPEGAGRLLEAIGRVAPDLGAVRADGPDDDGLMVVRAGGDFGPARWAALAADLLASGDVGVVVGTRGLLAEGWDAPSANCLVDLSSHSTAVAVRQARGRTLRLDPDDPGKLASNWDVVTVAPGHPQGGIDYERFVRRHSHVYAPTEDGALEAGVSHVHPGLSPFRPPDETEIDLANAESARRARDRDGARAAWRIGTPYAAEEIETLVVRPRGATRTPGAASARPAPPRIPGRVLPAVAWAGLAAATVMVALGAWVLALAVAAAALACGGVAATRLVRARRGLAGPLRLEAAAAAVAGGYARLGEIASAAARVSIEPRAGGHLRVALPGAGEEEAARFAAALDDLLAGEGVPRYLVSRRRPRPGGRGMLADLGRLLVLRAVVPERRWHGVPADLGRNRARAEAVAAAWAERLGPCELVYTRGAGASASAALVREPPLRAARRRVWR